MARPTDRGPHYNGIFKNKFNGELYLILWNTEKKCYAVTVLESGKGPKALPKGKLFYHVREFVKYKCERLAEAVVELKYRELLNNHVNKSK